MELNIGSMFLNGTKMENVTLSGMTSEDFLKMIAGQATAETLNNVDNKSSEMSKPASKNKAVTNSKNAVIEKPSDAYNANKRHDINKIGACQEVMEEKRKDFMSNVPDNCVCGIKGIMDYTGLPKKNARAMQTSSLMVYKTISCPTYVSPKGMINLYLKKDIDEILKKRHDREVAKKSNGKPAVDEKAKNDGRKYNKFTNEPIKVKATNIKTGEVRIVPSLTKCGKAFEVSSSTAYRAFYNGNLLKNEWQLEPFAEITKESSVSSKKTAAEKNEKKVDTFVSYKVFAAEIRALIVSKNKDIGKILSEAYKLETSVFGIDWEKAKKDYFNKFSEYGSNLQIAYWIEKDEIYGKNRGILKECVLEAIKKA